ncbi:Syndetin [Takifugu flavidus]|uniref:Syndetin n=1 Tax=Takifugu flavidus TaxID=433684 RepID=A0A5C6NDZ2_9TELE|nr:Syndetin [Takifugu flavidus]
MPCAVLVYHSGPERRAIAMDTLDQPPSEQNQPEHTGMESGEGRIEINRGREMSAQEAAGENAGVHGAVEERKEKVPSPHLSQLVVLTNSGTLYGLAQRVVATESL